MPPVNPSGSQKYWSDGLVFDGYLRSSIDPGTRKFWSDGTTWGALGPVGPIIVSAVGSAAGTSTVNAVPETSSGAGLMVGVAVVSGVSNVKEGVGSIVGVAEVAGRSTVTSVVSGAGIMAGVATFTGVPVLSGTVAAQGLMAGVATVTGVSNLVDGAGSSVGLATVTAVSSLRQAGIKTGAFTYLEPNPSQAIFNPRRRPEFRVQRRLNDAPDGCNFTTAQLVQVGQNIIADFDDGTDAHFQGPIQRVDQDYEEITSQVIYHVTITDYIWLLNRRRPFGCYEQVSISTIVIDLVNRFSVGFTTVGVQLGLPTVTITFDGSETFAACLTRLAELGNAKWRVDVKDLQFFVNDTAVQPNPITNTSVDLLRDPPIRQTEDLSQIRNRVFGRGAGVEVMNDTPAGSTSMWVEGADLFTTGGTGGTRASLGGGEMIAECQIFSYTGAEIVYVPTDRGTPPGSFNADPLMVGGFAEHGAIERDVRYQIAFVRDTTGESDLSPVITGPNHLNHITVPPVFISSPTNGGVCTGNVPTGIKRYLIAWKLADGTLVCDVGQAGATREINSTGSTVFPTGSLPTLPTSYGVGGTDTRVVSKVLLRTKIDDVLNYFQVDDIPLAQSNYTDKLADASLGTAAPTGISTFTGATLNGVSRGGIKVRLYNLPISDRQALKIYRSERPNPPGTAAWSTNRLLVTISDATTTEWVDNTDSTTEGNLQEAPAPVAKMRLIGIPATGSRSLTKKVKQGTIVRIWAQEDDAAAQVELATKEGGDGIHEYEVPGLTGITRVEDLRTRLKAELLLWARPIKTVTYGSRDRKTKPGRTVHIELSNPPIGPIDLKIQSVDIDQVHEADELIERYTVVASSVLFTLDDLLRRVLLKAK